MTTTTKSDDSFEGKLGSIPRFLMTKLDIIGTFHHKFLFLMGLEIQITRNNSWGKWVALRPVLKSKIVCVLCVFQHGPQCAH